MATNLAIDDELLYQKIFPAEMATRKSKQLIQTEVKRYIALLRKNNISVLQAYLFRSYAKGKADKWSDIDLAIFTTSSWETVLISDSR